MADDQPKDDGFKDGPDAAAPSSAVSAVAMARGRRGAKPDPQLDEFLGKQAALADVQRKLAETQMEGLREELGLQRRHAGLKYFSDRLRVGLQLIGIVAGIVVLLAAGALAWQAHEDHGLVVDAFSVPPQLAQDGLSGEVVATRVLDMLKTLQTATQSERPASSYQNNWGADLKVAIPQTGLTFGEFIRLLHEELGHQTHVTGEVVRTPTGITLTARYGDAAPQTFTGAEADLDILAQKAAEAVYRASQPYRYAEYLDQHGRQPEAIAVDTDLAAHGPLSERAWAYASLVLFDLERADTIAAQRDIDAGLAAGGDGVEWVNVNRSVLDTWLGHDEDLLDVTRLIETTEVQHRISEISDVVFEENQLIAQGYLAGQTGAFARTNVAYAALTHRPTTLESASFYEAEAAWADAMNHDLPRAQADLLAAGPLDTSFYLSVVSGGWPALPAYQADVARGDWPAALIEARGVDALIAAQKVAHPILGLMQPTLVHPLEARALLHTGDLAGAAQLISTTPADCYLCDRVRAEVAEASHDRAGADRWYAEATRQAPKIPFAFGEWGEAKLARSDVAGAVAEFQQANHLEPRFADALKDWGDALARQGRWDDARAKYDAALKLAPAWRELIQARAVAAQH